MIRMTIRKLGVSTTDSSENLFIKKSYLLFNKLRKQICLKKAIK